MKTAIKNLINWGIRSVLNIGGQTRAGRYLSDQALNIMINRTRTIHHEGIYLTFAIPNSLNDFRADTFSTKEPETLEWLDAIPQGAVLWDVGANVGLYTCYAAKARRCRVFAFEPSVFNVEFLARNIFLNSLTGLATIIPLPLSDTLRDSTLNMTTTAWGGALSTFGHDYGYNGQSLCKVFEFRTFGISMVDAVELLKVPMPDYIKMDVDGIEHLILKGGATVLRSAKGVLIEINEEFEKQMVDSSHYLRDAGMILKEKRHSEMFRNSVFEKSYNQIWYRPS